jgi:hypothetical protein
MHRNEVVGPTRWVPSTHEGRTSARRARGSVTARRCGATERRMHSLPGGRAPAPEPELSSV